jgi:hypothetical protein
VWLQIRTILGDINDWNWDIFQLFEVAAADVLKLTAWLVIAAEFQ